MTYMLELEAEGMPRHIGPFATHDDAYNWALVQVRNGSWSVIPLADPQQDWA